MGATDMSAELISWDALTPISTSRRDVRAKRAIRTSSAASTSREVLPTNRRSDEVSTFPDWAGEFIQSLSALQDLPENWDSYGGAPLAAPAIERLISIFDKVEDVIQSAPALSLTP